MSEFSNKIIGGFTLSYSDSTPSLFCLSLMRERERDANVCERKKEKDIFYLKEASIRPSVHRIQCRERNEITCDESIIKYSRREEMEVRTNAIIRYGGDA